MTLTKKDLHLKTVVPAATPATSDGRFDESAARRLYDHIVGGGCGGIMVLGTNGEGPSVPTVDRRRVVETAVSQVGDHALVLAGVGDPCLANSIEAGQEFLQIGARAVVAQAPVYFPIGQPELVDYFTRLANALDGALLIYNIPVTTRISLSEESIETLSRHPRIIGVKDSEPDANRQARLAARYRDREDFVYYSGSTVCFAACLGAGGSGTVPSIGNFAPAACEEVIAAAAAGDEAKLQTAQERLIRLANIFQKERTINRAVPCLKAALSLLGLTGPGVFPPLLPATPEDTEAVRAALKAEGLL